MHICWKGANGVRGMIEMMQTNAHDGCMCDMVIPIRWDGRRINKDDVQWNGRMSAAICDWREIKWMRAWMIDWCITGCCNYWRSADMVVTKWVYLPTGFFNRCAMVFINVPITCQHIYYSIHHNTYQWYAMVNVSTNEMNIFGENGRRLCAHKTTTMKWCTFKIEMKFTQTFRLLRRPIIIYQLADMRRIIVICERSYVIPQHHYDDQAVMMRWEW